MRKFISVILVLLFCSPGFAQQESTNHPTTPTGKFVLEDSTPVRLRLSRNVSSADAHAGDTVDFEVLEEVKIGDVVIIPKGGIAIGTVTAAEHKKRMARGGKLDMTIDSVRLVDGEKAALRGVKDAKGGGHTGAMVGAIVATSLVVWPAAPFFLFMHGKDTTIPKGTEITAYVNGNMELVAVKFQPNDALPTNGHSTDTNVTSASVEIVSTPPGADIEVDGSFVGNTPSTISLTAGEHQIRISKAGFSTWERKLKTSTGKIGVTADLQAAGELSGAVGNNKP